MINSVIRNGPPRPKGQGCNAQDVVLVPRKTLQSSRGLEAHFGRPTYDFITYTQCHVSVNRMDITTNTNTNTRDEEINTSDNGANISQYINISQIRGQQDPTLHHSWQRKKHGSEYGQEPRFPKRREH